MTNMSSQLDVDEELMLKCARFLKTLLRIKPQQQPQYNISEVKKLIREVVLGEQTPEYFTARLREVTKSQDKGNLLPFLRRSLPVVRRSIQKGEELELRQALDLDDFFHKSQLTSLPLEYSEYNSSSQNISKSPLIKPNNEGQQKGLITNHYKIEEPFITETNRDYSQVERTTNFTHQKDTITENMRIEMDKRNEDIAEKDLLLKQQDLPTSDNFIAPTSSSTAKVNSVPSTDAIDKLPRMLLNPQALADRILTHMPNAEGVDPEVLSIISNAAEARLRTILEHLAVLAAHRLEPLKINPMYQIINEPRKQLRFMEDIEKRAHENRQNAEKEALLKITKSKSKDKDSLEKAKQLQKADREEMVNREANAAAFAALGGSKIGIKRPFTSNIGMNGIQNQGLGFGLTGARPSRVKRVTMRDLQYFLAADPTIPNYYKLLHRISFSNFSTNIDENTSI